MVFTLKPEMLDSSLSFLMTNVLADRGLTVLLFIIELVFFGLSLMFLLSGVKSDKDKKYISKYNNVGETRISLNTIESIALAASRKLGGVKDNKAYVKKQGENVVIFIKTIVMPDINIPALLEDIQMKVKKSVEETTGIGVNEVKVSVENTYTGYRSRVE